MSGSNACCSSVNDMLLLQQLLAIEREYYVEARNLLLDERPLVHSSRALEQKLLRIERNELAPSVAGLPARS